MKIIYRIIFLAVSFVIVLNSCRKVFSEDSAYANQKNNEDAASYFERATELYEQADDTRGVINADQNRALMLTRMKKFD